MTRGGSVIPKGVPFGQLPHAINEDYDVTNAGYRVYGQFVKLANTESRAWPGHRYLEEKLPMSRPTIATAIANLEDTGWLVVNREKQNHTYTVIVEQAKLDLDWSRNLTGEETSPVKEVSQSGEGTSPTAVMKLGHIENQDREPKTDNQLAPRNVAWEFLTHEATFNLPTATTTQRKRVGRLARELNASLAAASTVELSLVPVSDSLREMHARAQEWPSHFPDATLTAEAFVKHFELLGAPPVKRSAAEIERQRTRVALDALEQRTDA